LAGVEILLDFSIVSSTAVSSATATTRPARIASRVDGTPSRPGKTPEASASGMLAA